MMPCTAFPEIQLKLGMRDIRGIGDCHWATPTHPAAITHTQGIYLDVGAMEHTPWTYIFRYISCNSPLRRESPKPSIFL